MDDIKLAQPKTKEYNKLIKDLKLEGKKVLVVTADNNEDLYRAMRNVQGARIMRACDVNTYAILDNAVIILTEGGLEVLNKK